VKGARRGTGQTDGRGVIWTVIRVEQGGRVLHWMSAETPARDAKTTITADHPDYPSDDEVRAYERAQRNATPTYWF
jgi:hypothetical protein